MAETKLYGKSLKAYEDIDIDALLSQLTEEELEELGQDLIDPDDPMVPPSQRCKYKMDKKPTGPFNRKQLLDFLEKKAKEEPDREEFKAYTKEKRGKIWQPKPGQAKAATSDLGDDVSETEWDEALRQASEEELVDLAGKVWIPPQKEDIQFEEDDGTATEWDDVLRQATEEELVDLAGKVFVPKQEERIQINEDEHVDTEWDEILFKATEEELVDLAAILGFHGMLNQVQYHKAFVAGGEDPDADATGKGGSGFQGVAKHENFKLFTEEPPNNTDVAASLQQLKDNDPKLKDLNLNNIKSIPIAKLCEIGAALAKNTNLENLSMANTRATDKVAKAVAESLRMNSTIKIVNMESNYISGDGIVALVEAIGEKESVVELRITNQRPQIIGCRCEMAISELVRDNKTLLRFGIFLQVPTARIAVQEYLKRNYDNTRRERMGQEIILPPVEEDKYGVKARLAAERAAQAETAKTTAAAPPPQAETKKEEAKKEETEDDSDESSSEEESSEE